ncbi:uncharacterized protein LOC119078999 [Bradysia coprophila]|uniref:uncharacterized protein LOC119078999 n=1 Tax=Bradysia coprophila TaxID=38358 RepID=UPI00187DA377|nr:uncharacterized protein LOC119078999 [Bradysia coprophila]
MESQLYYLKCKFYKKNFVSQRNGVPIYTGAKDIGAGDLTELLDNIWKTIVDSGCLEREVIVEGENVAWSADVPDIANNQIDKFVQIFDPKGRRNHTPTGISTDLLVSLRSKEVDVVVFVYTRNVATNGIFNIVKKQLLDPAVRDRSTAVANELIDEIIGKLKSAHSHHLTTPQPIGWRIWATFIAAKPTHAHEQLIRDSPPDHVVVLFRNIATSEAEILSNAQQGLRLARNVNGMQRTSLHGIRLRVQQLQSIINSCQREVESLMTHLEYLEQQAEREESLLCDMNNAVQPMESTFSLDTAELVTDCEDIDHMN